jgi:arylamine N-acetyltransferase
MNNFTITKQIALRFLEEMEINNIENTPEFLHIIIRRVMEIVPFTNIMMLVRPRRSPSMNEIIEDMISLRGGPCGHYNPFMNEILRHIGFESSLVPGWMNGKLSHMAIIVSIGDDEWWVDFGNGHPYLTPINITTRIPQFHAGLHYRIRKDESDGYIVEHRPSSSIEFEENYSFTIERVPFSHFDKMVEDHYTTPDFGPFLNGLRFIRFPKSELLALRNNNLLRTNDGELEKTMLTEPNQIVDAVIKHFPQASYPVSDGLKTLGWI